MAENIYKALREAFELLRFHHIRSVSRLILFGWVIITESYTDICVLPVDGLLFRMNICYEFIVRVWRYRWVATIIYGFCWILWDSADLGVHIFDDLHLLKAA